MFTQKMFAQQVAGDRLHLGALTDWGSTALRKSHVTFSKGCVPPRNKATFWKSTGSEVFVG